MSIENNGAKQKKHRFLLQIFVFTHIVSLQLPKTIFSCETQGFSVEEECSESSWAFQRETMNVLFEECSCQWGLGGSPSFALDSTSLALQSQTLSQT